VRFEVHQRIDAPIDAVAAALCDPAYYAALGAAPKLGVPEVLERTVDGDVVVMRVRYRFAGDLSAAARAVLDPNKLTWVDEARHDLVSHVVTFELQPDHYADRLSCRGTYRLEADPGDPSRTTRAASGELRVRAALVAGSVERALVSGLKEHLDAEAGIIAAFVEGSAL
jgi:hypothetical protein